MFWSSARRGPVQDPQWRLRVTAMLDFLPQPQTCPSLSFLALRTAQFPFRMLHCFSNFPSVYFAAVLNDFTWSSDVLTGL